MSSWVSILRLMPTQIQSRIVWESDDGIIRCTETTDRFERRIAILIADEVVTSRRFTETIEATRETDRLRKLFID